MRDATINRKTKETDIELKIDLDGTGKYTIETGIPFFNHMLEQLSKHAQIDIELKAIGDLEIDSHHTVEDVGIVLGTAIKEALKKQPYIERYGWFRLPMDEALIWVSMDIANRPFLDMPNLENTKIGSFDTELVVEFFRALAFNAGITLHIEVVKGYNQHHIIEAIFKAFARALKMAINIDPKMDTLPTTKGAF